MVLTITTVTYGVHSITKINSYLLGDFKGHEAYRDFLTEKGFKIGKIDSTLFTKRVFNYIFVCQIYVDGIIFGSTNKSLCDEFSKLMTKRFEMSMMRELTFFLGF